MSSDQTFNVVVAGGGVAGLESVLALRDLAGDRVTLQLVAPEEEFVYRPMTVREPFSYGAARRYRVADVARHVGAEVIADEFAWVAPDARVAHTSGGRELPYDALVLGLGARRRIAFDHAITIDDRRMDELLHGLIQDIEGGYTRSVAFLFAGHLGWPFPIYELALMTARQAYDMNLKVELSIVTPEDSPLAIFGQQASAAVADLLEEAGISVFASGYAEVPEPGKVLVHPSNATLHVDRVVAMPDLFGPAVRGLPAGDRGFIPVDLHCAVRGVSGVYAAGDATDFPVKYGGIAAQQADTAAEAIAELAGADVKPKPFHPEIHGMLLTGGKPRYLTAKITGGHGFSSQVSEEPTWDLPVKIAARYLAPYLQQLDAAATTS